MLVTEAAGSSEMPVHSYQITRRHIPEEGCLKSGCSSSGLILELRTCRLRSKRVEHVSLEMLSDLSFFFFEAYCASL
jgi:hypothetical protein